MLWFKVSNSALWDTYRALLGGPGGLHGPGFCLTLYLSPEAEEEDSVNNLCSTAHFALALKILLGQFNKRYDRKFQMRIGLAYGGPVIAGVIGSKKPQYDIWGKIVNLAARMDTTGDEGKIQVNFTFSKKQHFW